jgi:DNA-binding NarL/FixJ family response regulator
MALRCLIVDDNVSFREKMRGLLVEQGLDVVGGAGSAAEAHQQIVGLRPDLALIGVEDPTGAMDLNDSTDGRGRGHAPVQTWTTTSTVVLSREVNSWLKPVCMTASVAHLPSLR